MDQIITYVTTSNNVMTILSLIANIILMIPLLCNLYKYFAEKKFIKKVLSYNNDAVQIYQPVRELETIDSGKRYFISHDSLKSLHNVIEVFNVIDQKFVLVSQEDNASYPKDSVSGNRTTYALQN